MVPGLKRLLAQRGHDDDPKPPSSGWAKTRGNIIITSTLWNWWLLSISTRAAEQIVGPKSRELL